MRWQPVYASKDGWKQNISRCSDSAREDPARAVCLLACSQMAYGLRQEVACGQRWLLAAAGVRPLSVDRGCESLHQDSHMAQATQTPHISVKCARGLPGHSSSAQGARAWVRHEEVFVCTHDGIGGVRDWRWAGWWKLGECSGGCSSGRSAQSDLGEWAGAPSASVNSGG